MENFFRNISENFAGFLFTKFFPGTFSQKISRPGKYSGPFTRETTAPTVSDTPARTTFFRSQTPTNPGTLQPPFPNKARIEPRLASANPLSGAKLLEVFHKHRVRKHISDEDAHFTSEIIPAKSLPVRYIPIDLIYRRRIFPGKQGSAIQEAIIPE
jgi:hypothetical protein